MKNETLKSYLPLIVAIVSMGIAWGTFSAKIDAQERRINVAENTLTKITDTLTELRISQGQLQADVSFIKNRVK